MDNQQKLTVIIPFFNEEEEVRNTVASIRHSVGNRVDILLIDDASDSQYDYTEDVAEYDVCIMVNKRRIGPAASKNLGVSRIQTPYFLLLDAHMRFYDNRWLDLITDRLEQDDRKILCCQTKALQKSFFGEVTELPSPPAFGAYIVLDGKEWLQVKWNKHEQHFSSNMEAIPCILGAAYAGSKRYWDYLKGLDGLVGYGCEEPYLSLKAYLAGGACELLKETVVGHIYRKRFPYTVSTHDWVYNKLLIAELLFPNPLKQQMFQAMEKENREVFAYACEKLKNFSEQLERLKTYYQSIFTVDFSLIQQLNETYYQRNQSCDS